MMVSVRIAFPLPLIFLLMIHDVSSADWGVSYSHSHICALKNSSVIMNCTYTYPTGYQISKVFWTKTQVRKADNEFPNLFEDPEYSQRLQYLGDEQQNCTIRLSHVTQKDEHMYCFRLITNVTDGKWTGYPGVNLTVTDLQVESPERVTEGHNVSLTCKSSCALTDRATFIWYRNSQPLTERRDRNNQLLLQSVRRENAGRYSCALHGHTYISPAAQLSVTLHHGLGWPVWLGITVACAGLFIIIIIIVFIMRTRRGAKAEDVAAKQDDLYSNVAERDVHVSESAVYDDAPYASISSSKPRRDGDRNAEEIQYATVQHHKTKPTKRAEENENQYGNIRIHQPGAAVRRSDVETVEEVSVIYSHVK